MLSLLTNLNKLIWVQKNTLFFFFLLFFEKILPPKNPNFFFIFCFVNSTRINKENKIEIVSFN